MRVVDAPRPLSLDRFAGISARIEVGLPRERVLTEEQVSTETWELTQETWLARLGAHAAQRKLGLQRRYGELLATHRTAALLQLREERRTLSGPMPVAPVTRVALLTLPSLGKAEEVPSPAPRPIPTAQVGGATTDISAVVQNLLAGKAATPFGGPASAQAAALAPPAPPLSTAQAGGATTDISAVVQNLLAGKAATPFAGPAVANAAAVAPPAPPSPIAQLGATTDISGVVQNFLAGKAATPFGGTTTPPHPTTTAHPGSETTDISAVVQRMLAGQVTTPFARRATPAPPSEVSPTAAAAPLRALLSSAPRETQVGAATEDISSVVQRLLASNRATPFAETTSAPAVAAPVAAPTGALAPSAAGPDLAPHLPNLTLEHYAELRLQLWRDPARTAEILGLWRIADAQSWAQLQEHWQRRLADDAALAQRWTQVVAELKAARGFR
jgi:hypothetical protein